MHVQSTEKKRLELKNGIYSFRAASFGALKMKSRIYKKVREDSYKIHGKIEMRTLDNGSTGILFEAQHEDLLSFLLLTLKLIITNLYSA